MNRESTRILKDAASTKKKSYTTLINLSSPVSQRALDELSAIKELELKQHTPTRVANRRADLIRDKWVHQMVLYPENSNKEDVTSDGERKELSQQDQQLQQLKGENEEKKYTLIRMDLTTSAGTYVKEFVHGDDGRTNPCIKDMLGVDVASVLELDVTGVDLEWPERTGRNYSPLKCSS